MATDAEIQKFVQGHHGFIPKVGWIAGDRRGAAAFRRDLMAERA